MCGRYTLKNKDEVSVRYKKLTDVLNNLKFKTYLAVKQKIYKYASKNY